MVFDVDGVLVTPDEPFSWKYARDNNLDRAMFRRFFSGEFQDAIIGKADLRQLLQKNLDMWQWNGSVDELMYLWFESENVPDHAMLDIVRRLRAEGVGCYFATNQEAYRAQYMRGVMFDHDLFDGDYVSADMGFKKPDPQFFHYVINDLQTKHPGIKPSEILFIDDTEEHVQSAALLGMDARHYSPQSKQSIITAISNSFGRTS